MPEDRFRFISGPTPRSVRVVFEGFWDEEAVQSYLAALRDRAATSAAKPPIDRVLLDLRTCAVQSQAVMDSFALIIQGYAAQIREYGIILPESALLKLQMKRLMLPTSTRFFEDEGEALRWLGA
jgi:hypothetical protein